MKVKQTILISAATCLAVNIILSVLGWLGWLVVPVAWLACGWLGGRWVAKQDGTPLEGDDKWLMALGPILLIICSCAWIEDHMKFPKFRNPFYHEKPTSPDGSNP